MKQLDASKLLIMCAAWHLITLELLEQKIGSEKAGKYYINIIIPEFNKLTETEAKKDLPNNIEKKLKYWQKKWN
jgi:hypothetical protein